MTKFILASHYFPLDFFDFELFDSKEEVLQYLLLGSGIVEEFSRHKISDLIHKVQDLDAEREMIEEIESFASAVDHRSSISIYRYNEKAVDKKEIRIGYLSIEYSYQPIFIFNSKKTNYMNEINHFFNVLEKVVEDEQSPIALKLFYSNFSFSGICRSLNHPDSMRNQISSSEIVCDMRTELLLESEMSSLLYLEATIIICPIC